MSIRSIPRASRSGVVVAAAVVLGAIAACGGAAGGGEGANAPTAGSVTTGATPPRIGHPVDEAHTNCTSCHVVGAAGPTGLSEAHRGRDNSMCTNCHQPKS